MKQLVLKTGLAAFFLLFICVLVYCLFFAQTSDIVTRTDSPGGDFVAIVEETHGGQSKGFSYNVLVEPIASSNSRVLLAKFTNAMRNEQACGVNVVWSGPSTVMIQYLNAQSAYVPAQQVHCGSGQIKVDARSGIADVHAPPGGMLRNIELEKKKEIFGGN